MNFSLSLLFRAIPLVMALICLALGFYVSGGGSDADHFLAGNVLVSLASICFALFCTAATIIRQLVGSYAPMWRWVLPVAGYAVAGATAIYGLSLISGATTAAGFVAGHVIVGVGLITACVATVATASTRFTLIPLNSHSQPGAPVPVGAHSASAAMLMMAVPAVCGVVAYAWALLLLGQSGSAPHYVAGHVLGGLAAICVSLIALVAAVARQIRNQFSERERYLWPWLVVAMGALNIFWGGAVLLGADGPVRIAPGFVLIGLGLICFSILSKVMLLSLVWRQIFPLASRVPLIPVGTALACLFLAAFLFEAAVSDVAFFVPARVMVGLGAVCFTLFSIVSVLEAGTSGQSS
ncbi:MAG: DUF2776 family protein [Burkholderiaceae bacterium]